MFGYNHFDGFVYVSRIYIGFVHKERSPTISAGHFSRPSVTRTRAQKIPRIDIFYNAVHPGANLCISSAPGGNRFPRRGTGWG